MNSRSQKVAVRPISWTDRLAALRNIRVLLRMIWDTGPPLVLSTSMLHFVRAFLPVLRLWVSKLILDAVVALSLHRSVALTYVWTLVAVLIAVAVVGDLLGRVNTLVDGILGDRFTDRISLQLMQHSVALDLAAFEDPVFYDKLERARRQTSGRLNLLTSLLKICQDSLSLISLSAGLIIFSPWLMVLLIVAVLPSFTGESYFTNVQYSVLHRRTPDHRQLDYLRFLSTSLQSIKEVKSLALGDHLAQRYRTLSEGIISENKTVATRKALFGWALNLISIAGYYGAYIFALLKAITGGISIGTFTFLTGTFMRSRSYIEDGFSSFNDVAEQALSLKDLLEFLEMQPAIRSLPSAIPAPRPIRRGLEFENVGFIYPGSGSPVLKDIRFHLRPGEKIAVVGQNGAGKTTLMKLMLRLYDPTVGRILLDNVDLREYDLEDLRREIGVVFQDYVRYDMPVRDNVGFGRIDAIEDLSRIQSAVDKSQAKSLVDRLPRGYDQILGKRFEGGVELSGGEWQRLALARAYMRDAQVIVLDEPTASLDARAEHEVFQRFADLMRDRMAVLISHRFSTVRMADQILVLEEGSIQERGTHQQLVSLGGRYAELFELQAAGYR